MSRYLMLGVGALLCIIAAWTGADAITSPATSTGSAPTTNPATQATASTRSPASNPSRGRRPPAQPGPLTSTGELTKQERLDQLTATEARMAAEVDDWIRMVGPNHRATLAAQQKLRDVREQLDELTRAATGPDTQAAPPAHSAAPAPSTPLTQASSHPSTQPASAPSPTAMAVEEPPAKTVWEDYWRAMAFLFNGGSRAGAAERFAAVAKRWPDEDMAKDAAGIGNRLRKMVEEDRKYKGSADGAKLTGQDKIDYLIHELRDVAVSGAMDPGTTDVMSFMVGSPKGTTMDAARRPAVDLRKVGKDAIPALIALLEDDRLTRSVEQGFRGHHILEYRDVAIQILEQIAGRRFLAVNATGEYLSNTGHEKQGQAIADAMYWWEKNKDRQEHEWLADALLENGIGSSWDSINTSRRLIELRGAKCADVFRKVVSQEPDKDWPLILLHEAAGKGMLDDARAATKSKTLRIRATAYGILKAEGEQGVIDMAMADLAGMKEQPETNGYGNPLMEFLAGSDDDRAVLTVARLMLSSQKRAAVDALEAMTRANSAREITPARLRLILPYVVGTLSDAKLDAWSHRRTAEWIIWAAKLPVRWPSPEDSFLCDKAVEEVRAWWKAHEQEYPEATTQPATRPSTQPADSAKP